MSTNTEYGYTTNNNEIIRFFLEDGKAKNLSGAAVTKIQLEVFAATSDPFERVAPITSWNTVDNISIFDTTELSIGKIKFKPLPVDLTAVTESKVFGRLVVFTTTETLGRVWTKTQDDLFPFFVTR